MKKLLSCLLALALTAALAVPVAGAVSYTDIPANSALAGEVQKAVDYGLMNGYSAVKFGYGDSMTRAQFVTVLSRMMGWEDSSQSITDALALPANLSEGYRAAIGAAVSHDAVDRNAAFHPNDAITRGEMSEMLVRALGLKSAAEQLENICVSHQYWPSGSNAFPAHFSDVHERIGYIEIAYAAGMTKGYSDTTFGPDNTATRAQAAAMLVRIYEKLHQNTEFVHGFYAISSHSQLALAEDMDAVSAGWSRMTWDGETALLATTGVGNNEFAVPGGYGEVVDALEEHNVSLHLNVFMDGQSLKDMLASEDGRSQAVKQIVNELTVDYKAIGRNPYSGVTIDFEGLRSANIGDFDQFMKMLSREVHSLDKQLYLCVPPYLESDTQYNGYHIGYTAKLADKVILMAYGYDPLNMGEFVGTEYYKTAATTPIGQVYLGLHAMVDGYDIDPNKVVLGFSSRNVAWKIDENGKLLSGTPVYPTTETIVKRLAQSDTVKGYSNTYQQSYAIYTTEDGGRYFLWYQDGQSVQTSLNAAKLLGITGVSIWRLGTIPDSTDWNWNSLLN